jgi:hypothetical protein
MDNYLADGSNFYLQVKLPFRAKIIERRFHGSIEVMKKKDNIPYYLIHFTEPLRKLAPRDHVMKYAHCFDAIFTVDRYLVDNLDNAYWSPLSDCWTNGSIIPNGTGVTFGLDRTGEVIEKEFSVSFLLTKHINGNYQIRRDIVDREKDIKVPTRFYDSNVFSANLGHPKIEKTDQFLSDKIVLYKSMFNICPENFIGEEDNFSQKLTDCLINRTIPIYRGSDRIKDHFNMDGIIWISDGDDAIDKINKLTPEYYYDRLDAIEDNYNRLIAGDFHLNPGERISNMIKKIKGIK